MPQGFKRAAVHKDAGRRIVPSDWADKDYLADIQTTGCSGILPGGRKKSAIR
jgi:hypothetical protein